MLLFGNLTSDFCLFLFKNFLGLFYVYDYFAFMYICAPCICLQVVVNCHEGAGNGTQISALLTAKPFLLS